MALVTMPSPGFGSRIPVPPEVILMVIEKMEYEPGMLEVLMCVSQQFRDVIIENEASLSIYFARPYNPVYTQLCTSGVRMHYLVQPRTLPWVAECYLRHKILQDLLNDGFDSKTRVHYRLAGFCKNCFRKAVGEKGFVGLDILYKVFDAAYPGIERRETQMECISDLPPQRLAHLRILLYVLGAAYAMETVKEAEFENLEDYDAKLVDVSCIVREMLLRQGPYFIWAGLHGTTFERALVKRCIDSGIAHQHNYEDLVSNLASVGVDSPPGNYFVGNATRYSLQNYIVAEFCRKVKCPRNEHWNILVNMAADDFLETYNGTVHEGTLETSPPN